MKHFDCSWLRKSKEHPRMFQCCDTRSDVHKKDLLLTLDQAMNGDACKYFHPKKREPLIKEVK